jgi:hypothetical protein
LSNVIPQVHPTSSYIVRCDIIKNDYVVGGDLLAAFDRGDANIGQLIQYQPSNYAWVKVNDGSRSSITVSIWNQIDQPVHFRDTSVSIMLLIKPREYMNNKRLKKMYDCLFFMSRDGMNLLEILSYASRVACSYDL